MSNSTNYACAHVRTYEDALNYYLRRQKAALKAVERHLSSCTEALRGIFKNGSNREETICEMAKKKRRASATSDK